MWRISDGVRVAARRVHKHSRLVCATLDDPTLLHTHTHAYGDDSDADHSGVFILDMDDGSLTHVCLALDFDDRQLYGCGW